MECGWVAGCMCGCDCDRACAWESAGSVVEDARACVPSRVISCARVRLACACVFLRMLAWCARVHSRARALGYLRPLSATLHRHLAFASPAPHTPANAHDGTTPPTPARAPGVLVPRPRRVAPPRRTKAGPVPTQRRPARAWSPVSCEARRCSRDTCASAERRKPHPASPEDRCGGGSGARPCVSGQRRGRSVFSSQTRAVAREGCAAHAVRSVCRHANAR